VTTSTSSINELVAFALAERETWTEAGLRAALASAAASGWPYRQAAAEVCRLVFIDDATPQALVEASRNPVKALRHQPKPAPGTEVRGAALAREALQHRHDGARWTWEAITDA
jgi:hypothetical protein